MDGRKSDISPSVLKDSGKENSLDPDELARQVGEYCIVNKVSGLLCIYKAINR